MRHNNEKLHRGTARHCPITWILLRIATRAPSKDKNTTQPIQPPLHQAVIDRCNHRALATAEQCLAWQLRPYQPQTKKNNNLKHHQGMALWSSIAVAITCNASHALILSGQGPLLLTSFVLQTVIIHKATKMVKPVICSPGFPKAQARCPFQFIAPFEMHPLFRYEQRWTEKCPQ